MLPHLEWDYADKPDFNADGFYIDYDMVTTAHPPLRDRMFYGLNKVASFVVKGVQTHSARGFVILFESCSEITSKNLQLRLFDNLSEFRTHTWHDL